MKRLFVLPAGLEIRTDDRIFMLAKARIRHTHGSWCI